MDGEIKTDVSEVTIEMAVNEISAASKVDERQVLEESPSNPQSEQPQKEELSTENIGNSCSNKDGHLGDRKTDQCVYCGTRMPKGFPYKDDKPQRNEKGHFIEGNTVSVGNEGGRPCEFCERPVEIINKVNLYREWCRGKVDEKLHIPYLEELVSEDYLDITIDQLEDWVKSENHKKEHAELSRAIGHIKNRQKLYLMKRTVNNDSRGSMFLLSANYGVIEKSKQYQAGDKNEPLEYNIHIVPKTNKQQQLEEESA